ncbi:MAG: phosphatidate cytidylyltransferase [Tannerellaceae bacterium]|nr:phosphatidate cytidylyltransferase [Tannerellaceae bacterium]
MKNLIKRAITGIIFVTILFGAIIYDSFTFLILFSLIVGFTLWEFYGLIQNNEEIKTTRPLNVLGGTFLFIASFLYANQYTSGDIFLPYLLFLMYTLISELYYKASNPVNNWAINLLPQVYCAGSFSILNFITTTQYTSQNGSFYTPLFVLAIFIFVWLNDTGAYLIGTMFGKHRLFERISPKKSWEGFFGGLLFALIGSQVFAWYEPEISRLNWFCLTATIVIFATWGDLVESLLKRTLGVKDSGNVLPGHGGMLDRFDSVLMATPAAYIYIEYFIRN